nr:transcriptional repressor [Maridesulfovibrio bastinii]
MKPAHEVFFDYLNENGLNMTPQRLVILQAFLDMDGHFTSDELYKKVKQHDPAIGQATVYRTLKILLDSGIADCFDIGDGVSIFEVSHGQEHHDHLICVRCRKKIEIVDEEIEKKQEEVATREGFTITHHRLLLYGICPECQAKAEAELGEDDE